MIIRQTTKDILAASVIELAKHKSVEKITIKDISQNCGVTPTTFYNHFEDKYQLLAWIYNQEVDQLVAKSIDSLNWREVLVACCVPLQKNRTFYTNVLKNVVGQISFRHNTNDHAIAVWMENIRERNGLSEIPEDVQFCFRFYIRALSETINDWFLAGEKMPVEELAALMDNAMPEPLQTFLRNR